MSFTDWTRQFLAHEAKLVSLLQPRSYYLENFLHSVSVISDPSNGIFYVYPVIAALFSPSRSLSFDMMLIGSILSWLSMLLKWIFSGERPFWWIREIAQTFPNVPVLRQMHNTCVANPGFPSSHVMVNSGILLVLVDAILSRKSSTSQPSRFSPTPWYSSMLKWGCWGFYLGLLLIVMLSRVYNSAHFPHQCIWGATLGAYVANKISFSWNEEWRRKQKPWKMFALSLAPILIAVASYWIQKGLGIDPQRAVHLAFKWCFSPHDISVRTTPVYYLTCCCGCMFGLGVALLLQRMAAKFFAHGHISSRDSTLYLLYGKNSSLFNVVHAIGIFASACLLFKLQNQIPTDTVTVFYFHHFALNFAAPFLYYAFVPIILKVISVKLKLKKD
ncbi:glucose-6-phosphatase catalytic subunit 1 [Ischnura elegans]|uniref:glucose-6-phosphatase catalytic subunit 1 n=1 Tax=Ischnura elegans TaxID=197161 RepID=UPI001ED8BEBF|nr:glucose-6-phosphatase catalytic subunit 1 [Ischnura elegans]